MTWPVRPGAVPALAEKLSLRRESSPSHRAGRMAVSIRLQEQVYQTGACILGADNAYALAAAVRLAGGYYAVGRIIDAAKLHAAALARAETAIGPTPTLTQSEREGLTAITGRPSE